MAYFDKSIFKPEGSVISGVAVAGLVYALYQLDVGPVSQVHMTEANHPALETSRKKAGYTALAMIAALTLITRDGNIGILGFGTIVAMEIHYRHAIMVDHATGIMQPPSPSKYVPAEDINPPVQDTADTGSGFGY